MASSPRARARIAGHILFAPGFWDALSGRFLWDRAPHTHDPAPDAGSPWRDLRGALHVHTATYSDGAGTVPEVMDAARAAGVDFVLLTDHNTLGALADGWHRRYADAPPYLLIGDEITVRGGAFLLALDLPPEFSLAPGAEPQTAVDAVRAAGGQALVSLPFDMKHPWEAWDTRGCAGIEVLNLSTVAREHINILSLAWLLPLWRRAGTMAVLRAIAARPDAALRRWDTLLAGGEPVIGLGSLDAHALMKVGRKKYPIPSYADSFRAATTHVLIARDAEDVPGAIADALRRGRAFFSYDCLADPTGLRFEADSGATMGERAPVGCRLDARAAPGTLLRLYRGGRIVASGRDGRLVFPAELPGAYRIEAIRVGRWIGPLAVGARPWAFTNPIYVA